MRTIHDLHANLARSMERAARAFDGLAESVEALPGSQSAGTTPAKPKPRKLKSSPKPALPAPKPVPSVNGRCESLASL